MLVPKKNRLAVFSYLFKEGVLVVKKDDALPKHPQLEVPNLQVRKLLISLKSKGYVSEVFSWQHHFFSLTDSGIEYLREYLHVPADFVPATLKKQTKPQPRPSFRRTEDGGRGGRGGRGRSGRDEYRGKKADGAPDNFEPDFAGRGRGRGRGRGGRGRSE